MCVGARVGKTVGNADGAGEGVAVGTPEGDSVGALVGSGVGLVEGRGVGVSLGRGVGELDGDAVGIADGSGVGDSVGEALGRGLGLADGMVVGDSVGTPLGTSVGDTLGDAVCARQQLASAVVAAAHAASECTAVQVATQQTPPALVSVLTTASNGKLGIVNSSPTVTAVCSICSPRPRCQPRACVAFPPCADARNRLCRVVPPPGSKYTTAVSPYALHPAELRARTLIVYVSPFTPTNPSGSRSRSGSANRFQAVARNQLCSSAPAASNIRVLY